LIRFPQNGAYCDTSFIFAALHPGDVNYRRAGEILHAAVEQGIELFATWDVISETATLLLYRLNAKAAIRLLDELRPVLSIVVYDASVLEEAERVFRFLISDKKVSFCDAISFVVVRSLLNDIACLSFDEDFRRLGLTVIH